MVKIKIKDAKIENFEDTIKICVTPERMKDPHFIKGIKEKKEWAQEMVKKYGFYGKIAYINNKPIGLIQFKPKINEKIVEITCIYVPNKEHQRKGVAKALLKALIEDMKKPREWFNNECPLGLVTWAFEVPGLYPQHKFFTKMGFKKVKKEDPYLLYLPLHEDFVYTQREREYIPNQDDVGKVLVFYDPSCPFCIYFLEKKKQLIKEVDPNVPIREINMFREKDEVEKRGGVSFCIANTHPIKTSFFNKEEFKKEIKEALQKQPLT